MSIPVLTPQQSDAWDRAAEAAGIERAVLMESAGRAAAAVLAERYSNRLGQGVLIAAGLGNNGGDGWVVARALHRLEIPVWVASVTGEGSQLQRIMSTRARGDNVRVVGPDGPWPNVGLAVDALLGTGARGSPREPVASLLQRLLDLALPIVALDGPTGLDLETGVSHVATHADLSITFGGFRRGHLLGREEVGDVVVVDIGHPTPDPNWPTIFRDVDAAEWLPKLRAKAHKGDRGRAVVIGGDRGMVGAIRLAGRAAFAVGAGLVHAVAPADTVAALTVAEPDLQTLGHELGQAPSPELSQLLSRANAVLIGPGLGRGPGRREFVTAVLEIARKAKGPAAPVVLDADALTAFQGASSQLAAHAAGCALVLTPHPGEFRSLFPNHAGIMEVDPWRAALGAADEVSATVLLKGVPTVVATPGRPLTTVAAGNPGLATGGSGDVLGGLIVAALAGGLEAHAAAVLGAQTLGRAADLGARRVTARSLRPMDVINALPDVWRGWNLLRTAPRTYRPPIVMELEAPIRV